MDYKPCLLIEQSTTNLLSPFPMAQGPHYWQLQGGAVTQWCFLGCWACKALYLFPKWPRKWCSLNPQPPLCGFSISPITINLLARNSFLSNFQLLIFWRLGNKITKLDGLRYKIRLQLIYPGSPLQNVISIYRKILKWEGGREKRHSLDLALF